MSDPHDRLRPLVVQMLCGGNFVERAAWNRPLDDALANRCTEFILFNWPEFKLRVQGEEPRPLITAEPAASEPCCVYHQRNPDSGFPCPSWARAPQGGER